VLAALLAPLAAHAQDEGGPVLLGGFARGIAAQAAPTPKGGPRLLVALLFDQYRDDLLDRFRPAFGPDGFVRLEREGARFSDCTIPYAATVTGPGHATWLSGAPPSVHGIVGNGWYDAVERREVGCADDRLTSAVSMHGGEKDESSSPRWMRAQTVADVLRLTTRGTGRVVAMSDKARGAVLPAGRKPNGAYWVDDRNGLMETSRYYMDELPAWAVAADSARALAIERARGSAWTPRATLPAGALAGVLVVDPDDTFPHPFAAPGEKVTGRAVDFAHHPLSMTSMFEFAKAAVEGEGLGADDAPDLLVISISVTDRVGHAFGPESSEALDLASRADSALGAFLTYLDKRVGKGRYTVTLTADHGVGPTESAERSFAAAPFDSVGGVREDSLGTWVDRVLGAPVKGVTGCALSIATGAITFDAAKLAKLGLDRRQAARIVADSAYANPWLAAGYTSDELREGGSDADPIRARLARGYFPGRCGDVTIVPRVDVIYGASSRRGVASHGSPYRYDRHVPFLMSGFGVRPGTYAEPISTLDIAPTVSAVLGIEAPAQSEGRVLDEALTRSRP